MFWIGQEPAILERDAELGGLASRARNPVARPQADQRAALPAGLVSLDSRPSWGPAHEKWSAARCHSRTARSRERSSAAQASVTSNGGSDRRWCWTRARRGDARPVIRLSPP